MEESMDNNQMNGNNNNNNNNNNRNNKNGQMFLAFLLVSLVMLFIMSYVNSKMDQMSSEEITYSRFLKMVEEDKVESVEIGSSEIKITPKEEKKDTKVNNGLTTIKKTYYTGIVENPDLLKTLEKHDVNIKGTIPDNTSVWIYNILSFVIPLVLVWVLLGFLMRRMGGGGVMGVGKSNAKVYIEAQTGKTFKDVAGQDEAKEALQEIVSFLHDPSRYQAIGATMPKGVLLVGPPGTGKTLLAKAVAGEAKVPFFSISGSEFIEMFVGMGAARVRDLFKQAQEKAPCIVFIDEIDAIGKKRDNGAFGSNDEREQTLNQLLSEMDGFDGSKGVIILAATNRPEVLDKALLRPGRFDRRVPVELPDLKGREAILKVHSHDVRISPNVDYHTVALATSGASGAELANIVNEAALRAVRMGRTEVIQEDLEESVEVVIAGAQRKGAVISEKEKQLIAYHEIGHALVAASQTASAPVHKITIIPRTSGALGYTMQVDTEEKVLMTKEELFNKIVTLTGGRSAEEVVFNKVTSGASNDIEQATKLARAMITRFGMTSDFDMVALETVNNAYLSGDTSLACAPETAARIDEAVFSVVKEAHQKARTILETHRQKLDELAQYLLKKETITGDEFMAILKGTDPASAAAEQVPNSPQEGA